jgi:hypothetical protein
MDVFEYMTLKLYFVEEDVTADPENPKRNSKTFLRTERPLAENAVSIEELGEIFPKVSQWYLPGRGQGFYRFYPNIPSSYVMGGLLPRMSKLGLEGWEVVEYKFSTEGEIFAFALLKKKVQKD